MLIPDSRDHRTNIFEVCCMDRTNAAYFGQTLQQLICTSLRRQDEAAILSQKRNILAILDKHDLLLAFDGRTILDLKQSTLERFFATCNQHLHVETRLLQLYPDNFSWPKVSDISGANCTTMTQPKLNINMFTYNVTLKGSSFTMSHQSLNALSPSHCNRLIGSHCQPRWLQEAHYLRAIEGFIQAGSQLILQLVIVYQGVLIHSFRDLLKHILEGDFSWEFFDGKRSSAPIVCLADSCEINVLLFADKPLRWYWGLIQLYSLVLSALSFLQTCVHFNEWPKRRHTCHRLLLVLPFFASTAIYRTLAVTLLFTFAGQLACLPIGVLILAQVPRHVHVKLFSLLVANACTQ